MQQETPSWKGRLYLYLVVAGVGWGLLDWAVGGVLAPLRLPSKSVFLIPLAILVLAAARARTGLAGSCALMGVGAALGRMALNSVGRCPTGFLCHPVAMMVEALLMEGSLALVQIGSRTRWAPWSVAGAVAGALSPTLFAMVAISARWMPVGWGGLGGFLALRLPLCLFGGALASPAGAWIGSLGRAAVPSPEKAAGSTGAGGP
jgi:hypothetical protein